VLDGLTAFACVWYFRHELFASTFNVVFKLVFILAVGLLLLGVVLLLVWRWRNPAFFRGETLRHHTPALIVPE
jgi:hypothetical protein